MYNKNMLYWFKDTMEVVVNFLGRLSYEINATTWNVPKT